MCCLIILLIKILVFILLASLQIPLLSVETPLRLHRESINADSFQSLLVAVWSYCHSSILIPYTVAKLPGVGKPIHFGLDLP